MSNSCVSIAKILPLGLGVAACGVTTPQMQSALRPEPTKDIVINIVNHIERELACVVYSLDYHDVGHYANSKLMKDIPWLFASGRSGGIAKITLTMTMDEKTTLAPNLSDTAIYPNSVATFAHGGTVTTPQSFLFGLGVSGSAEANRKITTDYTFSIQQDLAKYDKAGFIASEQCDINTGALKNEPQGLMISGDLKIADSLRGLVEPYLAQVEINGVRESLAPSAPPDTLQTDITFTLNGTGTLNPFWKLVPISINPASTPLATSARNSIDEVLVTLGPNNPATATAHNITKANSGAAAVGAGGI